MTARRRLYTFEGGVLETDAYGEADDAGVYLEWRPRTDRESAVSPDEESGDEMDYRPTCLGYVNLEISGASRQRDETAIRALAERFGYDFSDMIVYEPKFGRPPLARLNAQITRLDAEAVFVPSLAHLMDVVPDSLATRVDVVTVHPERTYAREASVFRCDLPST
ncbi:hypothetical protein ABZ319_05475 [Nocardia sp. NPDC005978]|uniref:hypothetical protein n=1 Tax=Nocardia sp. NPDC005978 TaxID=3156725 RepID=UPI0033A9B942